MVVIARNWIAGMSFILIRVVDVYSEDGEVDWKDRWITARAFFPGSTLEETFKEDLSHHL